MSESEQITELQALNERLQRELIERQQAETELRQRNRELTILQSAGAAITSSLDLAYVLNTVTQEMTTLVGVESCALFEWHQAEDAIVRIAKYGAQGWIDPKAWLQVRELADFPVLRSVLEEQIPEQMTISQSSLDPVEAALMRETGVKSRMLVPMLFQQRVIGLVELEDSRRERVFTYQEISLVKLLANQAASAIENARLFEQAQQEIEERQRAEAALEQERALLAQRVQERTAELSRANAELARAARLKDEFLANMSHELRTPLNVILGSAEILSMGVFGELNEKQQQYVSNTEESGRHLLSLITDILDLSKIEAGKFNLDIRPVPVEGLCQATVRLVKELAHKKELKLNQGVDSQVKTIAGDERRLKQILVNLLSNAIKFTPEGGQVGLEVVGDPVQQVVRFTVWDTGIGIAAEDLGDLFQPFIQVDSGLARQYEGTGLGLSLVVRLTELHGGSVSVESQVGEGSRFTVSLPWPEPAVADDQPDPAVTPVSEAVPLKPSGQAAEQPLILLAEDNEDNIKTFGQFLQAYGFRLVIARNGQEAIDQALAERPDLILMDVQMPVLDGLTATRRLRAKAELAHVPIITLTALAMPGDRERCLAAGTNEYLSKPIRPANLIQTINLYLTQNQPERTL